MIERDEAYMRIALEQAREASAAGEIPVGAVIVNESGEVLAAARNRCEEEHLPTSHAELLAVQKACAARESWRLSDCTLYVTMEPCPMCMGAVIHARMKRVVFGTKDPRAGACGSLLDVTAYPLECRPSLSGGLLAKEARDELSGFFAPKREQK